MYYTAMIFAYYVNNSFLFLYTNEFRETLECLFQSPVFLRAMSRFYYNYRNSSKKTGSLNFNCILCKYIMSKLSRYPILCSGGIYIG